jgi:hypothetical protein
MRLTPFNSSAPINSGSLDLPPEPGNHRINVRFRGEMGHPHPSPSAVNGQEDFRQLPHKFRLLLRREHQVPATLVFGGKRGEDPASYTEFGRPHV